MSPIRFNRPAIDRSDAPLVRVAAGRQEERDFEQQPHSHGRGQLLCSCKGVVSVGLERGVWIVPPRHGIWIPPHCVHSARSVGVFQGWIAYVAEPACAGLPPEPHILQPSSLLHEAGLRAATWWDGSVSDGRSRW